MSKALTPAIEAAQTAQLVLSRAWLLVLGAVGCAAYAFVASTRVAQVSALAAALTLLMMVALLKLLAVVVRLRQNRLARQMTRLVEGDATPCFATDELGEIRFMNAAASARFQTAKIGTLVSLLQDHFASPGAVLYRLQRRAEAGGHAREDVVTRRGHTRLSVHQVAPLRFLWRLEEFVDRNQPGRGADTLSLPMLVANKSGVVLFANEALRRLAGSRPKRLDRLFVDEELRSGEEVTVSTETGPVTAILAEIRGAGDRREIYLMPVPSRAGPDRVMADFEQVPVAMMKFSCEGQLIALNFAARQMTGIQAEGQQMIHEIYMGLGRSVTDWLGDVAQARLPDGAEVLKLRAGEGDQFHQVALRRIVENGRPSVLAVLSDATQLKTLEAQFTQSQKMQAIGQLAGGIAHDFNNLLTAISGHCDLMMLRHDPLDPDYEDLVQIHQNSNRAAGLVGQLLAYSRKQTLNPERIDLPDVLSDLAHLLNRLVGEKVRLRLDHDPQVGPIRVDRRHFEQVIMNLVVNARDAMTKGGTIKLETLARHLEEPMARDGAVVPAGLWSVIRVSDSGIGMTPELRAKIFEPFFTTKRPGEGTGLGLSTVYGIVKQSGGYVFVDSELGVGTVFELYFPRHDEVEDRRAQPEKPRRQPMRPGEGVVLLVEDEAPVRAFASRALRMRGFSVIEAESAEEALEKLQNPDLEVDIFVTDVVMPGMDGPSWVRQALKERPNVRVIFVSGYAEDCLSEDQARIPNSVFLPKPFSLNELTMIVQGQMH